jgi:hypothetical protein
MGAVEVPADKDWGAQTQRSLVHFSIGDDRLPKAVYHAYGQVKKAAAVNIEAVGGTFDVTSPVKEGWHWPARGRWASVSSLDFHDGGYGLLIPPGRRSTRVLASRAPVWRPAGYPAGRPGRRRVHRGSPTGRRPMLSRPLPRGARGSSGPRRWSAAARGREPP